MVPPISATLIVEGYGVAAPESGIVITAVLVKDFVPVAKGLTVSRKLLLALNCPSLTLTVIVAVPLCPAVGVTVTVRFDADPPNAMLVIDISAKSDEYPLTCRLTAGVSASPTVK